MARILVVDDHPHIVRLVRRELERDAHEVLTAADGEEALRIARELQPAVVVLDVVMPRRNGFEVLRELKSDPATRDIVVIMLTVKDKEAEFTHGLNLGADWYLPKPFVPGDIAALVQRFLLAPPPGAGETPPPASPE
jgi:DNA-binding response OmpR family regulator